MELNRLTITFILETLFTGKIQHFKDEIGSTNNWASQELKATKVIEGTVYRVANQTNGKGQRGRVWSSERNVNILSSFVFYPTFIKSENQFVLVQLVSLAIKDLLSNHVIDTVKIKWPNDIYINHMKIAGVLIESTMKGSYLASSIWGIGLNVNQRLFENAPNATSLILETGRGFNLEMILSELSFHLEKRYLQVKKNLNSLNQEYGDSLYRKEEICDFELGNEIHQLVVKGVDESGQIMLEDTFGRVNTYGLHQARMVI